MQDRLRTFFQSGLARRIVLTLIVVNAIVLGVETDPGLTGSSSAVLSYVDHAIVLAFVIEIALRMIAGGSLATWFAQPWNVFDFIVVALCFVPAIGTWASVARVLRVFRLLRATEAFPALRRLIGTIFRSLPAFGHIAFLLALISYVYAVIGAHVFQDRVLFDTLPKAMLTLFQVLTLEGWDQVMATVLPTHPWAWIYFTSYILIGTYVLLNMTIAVITSNLDESHHVGEDHAAFEARMLQELQGLKETLARIEHGPPDA